MPIGAFEEVTGKIIGCAFRVLNTLGPGFLEKVYENAMMIELQLAGLKVQQQVPLKWSIAARSWASTSPIWSSKTW